MTKSRLLVLVIAVSMILAASAAFARSWFDTTPTSEHAARIQQYQLQNVKAVTDLDDASASSTGQATVVPRQSLGSALSPTAGSPGVEVDNSYDDWQWTYGMHHVEWRGRPYIHFAYVDRQAGATGVNKHGYNGYNPIAGQWPRGQNAGCQLQSVPEETGLYPNLDVNSKGRVVMAGHATTFTQGAPNDNRIFFQPTTAFSCSFGVSYIDPTQYETGMINPKADSARLYQLMVEEQEWAGDTITHLIGQQGAQTPRIAGKKNLTLTPMQYFRKMTFSNSGSWIGPLTLDTSQRMAHLCASRVSPKVALIYIKYTPEGITHDQFDDQAIWYRESDSIGITWKAAVNIMPYDRSAGPSWAPWVEAHGLYDSNDKLHIIYNASPVAKNPYDVASNYTWGILTTGSSIFHWSNATGVISRIHNAEWDNLQALYQAGTFCGFMGTNYLTTGAMGLSECHGRLYVTWTMGNDPNAVPALMNDCGSGGVLDNRYKANGEIYLSVSSDLSGLLWDKYRDLTNTHTPLCDSAGFGGVCMSDTKATMSRYGMDITSFDTNGTPVSLIWPDTGVNPSTTHTNYYTHLFYTEDHWVGNKGAESAANTPQGQWTLNPLKWMRLACVDPISAPQIDWIPKHMGYAEKEWVKHHKADTTVVTVTNDGNATLHVTAIGVKKTSQTGVDWLGTSTASLTVNAGVGNTATFSIFVNKGGIINSPGTIVALNGEVGLKTDVAAPRDTCTIKIENFLVADSLVGMKWDTVTTGCTRLVVSNNGDVGKLGNGGQGGLNLDYILSGTECDSASINYTYLYDAGPVVVRKSGATYVYSSALHQGDFVTEQAFKPIVQGPTTSHIAGVGYDGFYTGTFVNKDTTIGVRRTYYAPTYGSDTCNFIVQKTVFFGIGGAKTNVTLGEVLDFDVPSDTSSANDGRVLASKSCVYQQGRDTLTVNNHRCVTLNRKFASAVFLGMFTSAEYLADTCKNDVSFYGSYVMNNDTLFKYDTLSNTREGEYYWTRMSALSGLSAAPTQAKDLHTVVTYKSNMASLDTLTAYTAVVSVRNGDTTVLKTGIDKAKAWYFGHVRHCKAGSCCSNNSLDGRTGNVDADPGKGVDISDLSALIDYLYISFTVPSCLLSANTDGDPDNGVDISDLSALIDYLYISFTPPALCH